ncbi:MAG: AAA family ATPase, partial [Verrucomicrobia bacterium]|nr:AAA family ATPase [Verrucomicrobiota bacterium]
MPQNFQANQRQGEWWQHLRSRALRFGRLFAKFWWIVLFTTAAGLAVASWLVFQQKEVYVSTGRMVVSGRINIQQGASFSEELANFFGTQVELMKSAEVREKAASELAAREPQLQAVPVSLTVSQLPQTSIFVLSTTGSEPQYTQKILDAIMQEYVAAKKEMRSLKSDSTQMAITDEISRIERDIRQGESELLAFQKQNNVGYLEQEGNSAGAYLATLNRQLADLRTQYELLASLDIDQIIEKNQKEPAQAGDKPARAVEPDSDSLFSDALRPEEEYLQAKQRLSVLKAQRDEFAKDLRPKHPQMVELGRQISEQEMLIASFRSQSVDRLKSRRDAIKHQIDTLESAIKEWSAKALSLSQRLAEYNRIKAAVDRSKGLYDRLVNNLHEIDVTRNLDQDLVSVLEKASPAQPVKPGMARILTIGTTFGLLIGLAILTLMFQIDDKVVSTLDLESRFDEHVLVQIPSEKRKGLLEPLKANDDRHAFAESLRALRSSLLYLPFEGGRPKTLLITSATPNEGKSTVAVNLAITMALAQVRVLLVDADLRRGTLHRVFNRDCHPGLSELLLDRMPQEKCILPTSLPNLNLATRGTSIQNPGEIFLSASVDQFLRDIYESYDCVIFDSSPVLAADDTTSLAPKLDAALMI